MFPITGILFWMPAMVLPQKGGMAFHICMYDIIIPVSWWKELINLGMYVMDYFNIDSYTIWRSWVLYFIYIYSSLNDCSGSVRVPVANSWVVFFFFFLSLSLSDTHREKDKGTRKIFCLYGILNWILVMPVLGCLMRLFRSSNYSGFFSANAKKSYRS